MPKKGSGIKIILPGEEIPLEDVDLLASQIYHYINKTMLVPVPWQKLQNGSKQKYRSIARKLLSNPPFILVKYVQLYTSNNRPTQTVLGSTES